jgi:hypothetical protein
MVEALKPLTDADVELKAKILIRRTIVELCENKFYEALDILNEARPVFESANDALKGRWHGQMGLVLARLARGEGRLLYRQGDHRVHGGYLSLRTCRTRKVLRDQPQ